METEPVKTSEPGINHLKPSSPKSIPIESILEYRAKGLSMPDIAKLLGCSTVNIYNRLDRYEDYVAGLDSYRKNKSVILDLKQSMLLDNVNPESIKGMSVRDSVVSFGILYDKQALHEGRATSIVNYSDISNDISKLEAEIQAIEMKERDGIYQSDTVNNQTEHDSEDGSGA